MKQMGYILITIGIVAIIAGIVVLRNEPSSTTTETTATEAITTSESSPQSGSNNKSNQADDLTDNERKGREFEEWVVSKFPKSEYTLKEWRGDKYVDGTYAESNRYPDLELELNLKNSSHLFAVECKYRSYLPENFEWTSQEKIHIYNAYARERQIPTFIIFGIGGTPSAPEEVIIAPLDKLQQPNITAKYLRSLHHHEISRTFYYYAKENRLM